MPSIFLGPVEASRSKDTFLFVLVLPNVFFWNLPPAHGTPRPRGSCRPRGGPVAVPLHSGGDRGGGRGPAVLARPPAQLPGGRLSVSAHGPAFFFSVKFILRIPTKKSFLVVIFFVAPFLALRLVLTSTVAPSPYMMQQRKE